ncbi:hypothetical protein [Algoriphagus resistens]|uniref:hypothetical protein n=1 Tax=Algoriphagus resistens TaxID=1750590 RepID=UPI000B2636BB|nr:hypothetical protein [Algoriphagus resistens]
MNLEQLNVVELSSEELVETTGGRDLAAIFAVTPEAYNRLLDAVWEANGWN